MNDMDHMGMGIYIEWMSMYGKHKEGMDYTWEGLKSLAIRDLGKSFQSMWLGAKALGHVNKA